MHKLLMILAIVFSTVFYGCSSVDLQNDSTLQILAGTTIQLATAAYLENNKDRAELLTDLTFMVIVYIEEDKGLNLPIKNSIEALHLIVYNLRIPEIDKVLLITLIDIIITEAIEWANVKIEDTFDPRLKPIFLFCANKMNSVASLYMGD